MAAVPEQHARVVGERLPREGEVDEECEVEDDVEPFPEPDSPHGIGAPQQRRKVGPVAAIQAGGHRLAAQDRRRRRREHRLDPIPERAHHLIVGIDHLDTRRDHRSVGMRVGQRTDTREIPGQHHVVAAHHDVPVGGDEVDAASKIAVHAEVVRVAFVVDAAVVEAGQPFARLIARITIVDDDEPKVGVRLLQNAGDCLLELLDVAVEGHHDVDRHPIRVDVDAPTPSGHVRSAPHLLR